MVDPSRQLPLMRDNPTLRRYEMVLDDGLAFIDYRRSEGVVTLLHAEVPHALEGRGVGSALTRSVLEAIRVSGEKVIPQCSFVVAYIHRHPEFQDMLAD